MLGEPSARAAAKLMDAALFTFLGLLVLVAAAFIFGFEEDAGTATPQQSGDNAVGTTSDMTPGGVRFVFVGGGIVALAALANEVGWATRTGQSLGRRRLGLHVLDAATLQPVSRPRLALRFVVAAAPIAIGGLVAFTWFGTWLGILGVLLTAGAVLAVPGLAFFRDDKRGLHDLVAGTVSVEARHSAPVA
jgi:uncharacterized RDD family membrane protein YckC